MKHLQKSNSFKGAKVTLYPPAIGPYRPISTYETNELIDLICDGPIEGLVNGRGSVLDEDSYLQGVFLNGVPVQNTDDGFIESTAEVLADFGRTNFVKEIGRVFLSLYKGSNPGGLPLWGPSPTDNSFNGAPMWSYSWGPWIDGPYATRWTKHIKANGQPNSWCGLMFGDTISNPFVSKRLKCGSNFSCYVGRYVYSFANTKCFSVNYRGSRLERDLSSLGFSNDAVRLATSNTIYDPSSYTRDYINTYFRGATSTSQDGITTSNQSSNTFATGYLWLMDKRKLWGINSDTFWYKNIDNWYVELSLNETYSFEAMFQSNGYPVNRNKIIDSINDLVSRNNDTNSNRFAKEFISKRLISLGINKSKLENLSFNDIKEIIKKELNEKRPHYCYSGGADPYMFVSHNENIFEGYVESLHKRLFINEREYIENFQEAKQYLNDDRFYSNGVYYRAKTSGFLGTEQDIINDQAITEEENRQLAVIEDLKDQVIWNSSISISTEFSGSSDARNSVDNKYFDFLMPVLDEEGEWYGQVFGFTIENINTGVQLDQTPSFRTAGWYYDGAGGYKLWSDGISNNSANQSHNIILNSLSFGHYDLYTRQGAKLLLNRKEDGGTEAEDKAQKYNFSNILVEFRNGESKQEKLDNFKDIFIDKYYNQVLLGPFSIAPKIGSGGLQRLLWRGLNGVFPRLTMGASRPPTMDDAWLEAYAETSDDNRSVSVDGGSAARNFSSWSNKKIFNEEASPIVHVINNPTVEQVFITLDVLQLYDTSEDESGQTVDEYFQQVGGNIPAPLNIRVEVGLIDEKGEQQQFYDRHFQIISIIQTSTLIDLGNPYKKNSQQYIKELNPYGTEDDEASYINADSLVKDPFVLPAVSDFSGGVAESTEIKEDSQINRYVKVTRLNVESTSSLMKRKVNLAKITEIIPLKCSYPFSSIVGLKTNSQSFQSIPERTFRCKLKKIKIPSNYFPIQRKRDIRYWEKNKDFKKQEKRDLLLYQGDWDGNFRFAWSDNPAWVLYDILTSSRYGLGSDIKEEDINKWQLYEIGRFCDSVDEQGYFKGVEDGRGGIEPRFSCNIIFEEETKIFDAINSISSLFRGVIYYSNGALTFRDDRLTSPVAFFNNENVREGVFSYSNYKKEEVYNAVEVIYKDKFNDYKTKLEYVEDQADIAKRGVFKKTFTAVGVTSKAMAKRAAYHIMVQTTKENESLSFITGPEALLCSPGDLIIVDDVMKSLASNYGRILDIDLENNSLRLTNKYSSENNDKEIKVFVPNASQSIEDIEDILFTDRSRVENLTVQPGVNQDFNSDFAGYYEFSNYQTGFNETQNENILTQYPLFVKSDDIDSLLYYNTGYTGWVFAVGGTTDTDDEQYDKYILRTEVFNLGNITDPLDLTQAELNIHSYDVNQPDRRGAILESASGKFLNEFGQARLDFFGGVLSKEIQVDSAVQIQTFKILNSDEEEKEYGDTVYLDDQDPNINLLQFVQKGSSYRLGIKDASERIYKISTIKEEDDNTYAVSASKYYSGKYREIEEGFNEREKENTYGHDKDLVSIKNKNFIKLPSPEVSYKFKDDGGDILSTPYYITGSLEEVANATGYLIEYTDPEFSVNTEKISSNSFFIETYKRGFYNIKVKALSEGINNSNLNTIYLDSEFTSRSIRSNAVLVEDDSEELEDNISFSQIGLSEEP